MMSFRNVEQNRKKDRIVMEIILKIYPELKDSIAGFYQVNNRLLPSKQHSGRNRFISEHH